MSDYEKKEMDIMKSFSNYQEPGTGESWKIFCSHKEDICRAAMLLYAVTDRSWTGKQTLTEQVEAALKGGVTCIQLREKELMRLHFWKKLLQ